MSMITDELLQFIQGKLRAGVSSQEIEKTLASQGGWSKPDIEEAFRAVSQAEETLSELRGEESSGVSPAVGAGNASKNSLPLLPIFAGVGVLAVAGVVYVVFGSALGLRYGAPNDIDGFLADFIEAAQKIEKFEYEVALSAVQEPRDENLEPLVLDDPEHEARLEAVERDVEILRDTGNLRFMLGGGDQISDNTLSALAAPSDIDTTPFAYTQVEGGSDYELTVQFETAEMLDYLEQEKPTEGFEDTQPDIDRESLTATFSKDDMSYFFVSANTVLPKSPAVAAVEQLNMMAQFLPSRFAGDLTFSGMVGLESEKGRLPDTEASLAVNADWGDLSVSFGGDALVKDEQVYVRVNNFPSLFFIDIEPIREKWVELPADEYQENLVSTFNVSTEEDSEALSQFPKILAQAVSEHNPFILKEGPRHEELEDGRSAYGYSLGINGETFADFYESLYSEMAPLLLEDEELEELNSEIEEQVAFLRTEEFLGLVEYMNEHTEFVVWMDEKTGYPVQYSSELVFAPNSEALSEDMMPFGSGAPKDTQLRLSSVVRLTGINKDISIEAPTETMTYEEANELLFGAPMIDTASDTADNPLGE